MKSIKLFSILNPLSNNQILKPIIVDKIWKTYNNRAEIDKSIYKGIKEAIEIVIS